MSERREQAAQAGGDGAASSGVLVLLRHGRSEWNGRGRFTGWADVCLTEAGRAQAERAGGMLREHGFTFDVCFTSVLRRAELTAEIALRAMGLEGIAVRRSWRLNERHYGALEGLGIWPAVRGYGLWAVLGCRTFHHRPPQLETDDARFPGRDPRYASVEQAELPRAESLADTRERVMPYWRDAIAPQLASGRRVLVVSHKNTLRVLLGLLERGSAAPAPRLSIGTGTAIVVTLDARLQVRARTTIAE